MEVSKLSKKKKMQISVLHKMLEFICYLGFPEYAQKMKSDIQQNIFKEDFPPILNELPQKVNKRNISVLELQMKYRNR